MITEKPLARTTAEGEAMVAAVEKAGVAEPRLLQLPPHARRSASSSRWSTSGKLGRIFHYRAKFLQDWTISPDVPQGGAGTWRLDVEAAGSGVTGDLLAHCLDTAIWINGAIASLTAMTETFVKERTHAATGKMQPVGIDDAAAVLTRFANGSLGTFESTRYARGHKALYTLEINGEHGSLAWDLHDLNRARLVRPPRRGRASRLELDPRHRRRAPLPRQVVGAGPHHRLRAFLRAHHGRLHRRAWTATRPPGRPSATRWRPPGLRRDHRLGQDRAPGRRSDQR